MPCKKSINATYVGSLFFKEIARLCEIPEPINFDADIKCVNNFLRSLRKKFDTALQYNNAYYFQIDC